MNYFQLFDLNAAFELDTSELQQRYRALQQRLHPDRFANAGEREKLQALQKAAEVNDGYQTLRQPVSRAEHLLSLRGLELAHEQSTINDREFLMTQMELREAMAEINDDNALTATERQVRGYIADFTAELHQQLSEQTQAADQQAADTVRKLKFMYKLIAELERIEDSLFDAE